MALEYPASDRLVYAPVTVEELLEYGYKRTVANMRHNRTRDSAMTWGQVADFLIRRTLWHAESPQTKFSFSVRLKDGMHLIGNVSLLLYPKSQQMAAETEFEDRATVGFEVASPYWENGYGTEILQATLDWAFKKFSLLYRVWGDCTETNVGSQRVMTKAGMQREARLRDEALLPDGRRDNVLIFGILRKEWEELQLNQRS